MQSLKLISGKYRIRLTSADIPGLLTAMQNVGIRQFDVKRSGDLSVDMTISRKDRSILENLLERRGEKAEILHRRGLFWAVKSALKRPLLIACLLTLVILSAYLPTRVLFVRVEGNVAIPSRYILDIAEQCGIGFGASRRLVRSENVKNTLLEQIPDLSWVGVNTNGFVATITVREKNNVKEEDDFPGISSIVASRDGVIRDITVTNGSGICQVGQAVKAGQVLISGYEDLGILVRATKAEGEITAQTLRQLEVIAPICTQLRGDEIRREIKHSLIIGKKQIKLYKDSGISDSSCVKIYRKVDITLPGDLNLPVSFITEEWIYYDTEAVSVSEDGFEWMTLYAREYLSTQMIAGSILTENTQIELLDDGCLLTGRYACLEMIGQVRNEEIIKYNGKNS